MSRPSEDFVRRKEQTLSEKTAIDALIMKGGGVKGLAFAGAIRELERFFDFRAFVGTSAGAIAAALLAAGATGAQLEDRLSRKPFREFLDGKLWMTLFTFPTLRGLHPGYSFVVRDQHL
jgi:predicted acylesterase/phospholipase RssA